MCTWLKSFQWFQQKATYANILDHYQQQINREMHLASIDNDADTFLGFERRAVGDRRSTIPRKLTPIYHENNKNRFFFRTHRSYYMGLVKKLFSVVPTLSFFCLFFFYLGSLKRSVDRSYWPYCWDWTSWAWRASVDPGRRRRRRLEGRIAPRLAPRRRLWKAVVD